MWVLETQNANRVEGGSLFLVRVLQEADTRKYSGTREYFVRRVVRVLGEPEKACTLMRHTHATHPQARICGSAFCLTAGVWEFHWAEKTWTSRPQLPCVGLMGSTDTPLRGGRTQPWAGASAQVRNGIGWGLSWGSQALGCPVAAGNHWDSSVESSPGARSGFLRETDARLCGQSFFHAPRGGSWERQSLVPNHLLIVHHGNGPIPLPQGRPEMKYLYREGSLLAKPSTSI